MNRLSGTIERINTQVGKAASFLILVLIAVLMYEVLSRYIFNEPTRWSNEISQYLLTGVVMLGGGYCLAGREHVRVDVLFRNFGHRTRCVIEILTFLIVMTFVSAIVWKGGELCYDAFLQDKRSMTIMELPLFPSMVLVPIGAFLLGLQSLGHAIQAVLELLSPYPETKKEI
jgi:TRAP-type mannitol/chloroaromatic compound transport system permease small subunit